MKIQPFELERYFAKYEFSARYLLSASDCEALSLQELLALANDKTRQMWEKLSLGYTESPGNPLLRQLIAKLYSKINPEQVIVMTPEEGIFIAMNVLLNKDDHVIVTSPGYQSLYEIANSIGCGVTKWEPDKETREFDIDFVRNNIRSNTKLLVINFPHNPTGSLINQSQLDGLISLAREHNLTIFSDEMYRLLEYDEKDRVSAIADVYENGVSLFGVSKTFALAGLRIGWLATQNKDILDRMAVFKDYTTICSSAPSEVLAMIALESKDVIIKRNLSIIKSNLRLFESFTERHTASIKWRRPKAGTTSLPELIGKDVNKLCEDIISSKGLLVLPASVFGIQGNTFRIGAGRKSFPQALKIFEEYIDS